MRFSKSAPEAWWGVKVSDDLWTRKLGKAVETSWMLPVALPSAALKKCWKYGKQEEYFLLPLAKG